MLPENIIFFAIILNIIGHFFYIFSIVKGYTKPNLVSWVIWTLAPFIGVFFQLKAGAGLSVLPVFMAGFGPFMIVIASILTKNAIWKINTFDIYCGVMALFSLIVYVFTHNLGISIIFAILSDVLAAIPTFVKSWKYPESESSAAYSWAILPNIIGLLIIKKWTFPIYSFGIWLIIFNITMICILYRKKIFNMLYFKDDQ